jgi:hypothetical protein
MLLLTVSLKKLLVVWPCRSRSFLRYYVGGNSHCIPRSTHKCSVLTESLHTPQTYVCRQKRERCQNGGGMTSNSLRFGLILFLSLNIACAANSRKVFGIGMAAAGLTVASVELGGAIYSSSQGASSETWKTFGVRGGIAMGLAFIGGLVS